MQIFGVLIFIGVIALTPALGAPMWLTVALAFGAVVLQAAMEIRHYRRTGEACGGACGRGPDGGVSALVAALVAVAVSSGPAHAAVSLSKKGCALKAHDCELLIENAVMYNAVYDGTSTMYSLPQKSVRYRLARWTNAFVEELDRCETPKEKVRQIIGGIKSFDNTYDILAPYWAAPGSVCYIRKSAS
jgi:hypothetical protein